MKNLILFLLCISALNTGAQILLPTDEGDFEKFEYPRAFRKPHYNIAVLTPLFLDSFDISQNLTRIPKFMMPGIDFYQGVEIAADTLRKLGYHFNIYIFDSKSNYLDVTNLIQSDRLDSMDLIIGNASIEDLKILGDFSKKKEINFISAVSPSDADQKSNPYFTILQPRLTTHVEELHRIQMKRYPEDNVVFIYGDKGSEQNALDYFRNDPLNPTPGRFHEYKLEGDLLDVNHIKSLIDTNYHTTIIMGILNPSIAYKNLKALLPEAKNLNLKVFGMPTMEMITTLNKTEEFPFMPIYYTTSYVNDNISPASKFIRQAYYNRMGTEPTELVYKGFESVYYFANMMERNGVPFNEHISDNQYSFLTPYKILPVKEKGKFQYYENKYLYILRFENGIMTYE